MLPIFAKERNNIMDAMVLLGMAIAIFASFFAGITSLKTLGDDSENIETSKDSSSDAHYVDTFLEHNEVITDKKEYEDTIKNTIKSQKEFHSPVMDAGSVGKYSDMSSSMSKSDNTDNSLDKKQLLGRFTNDIKEYSQKKELEDSTSAENKSIFSAKDLKMGFIVSEILNRRKDIYHMDR